MKKLFRGRFCWYGETHTIYRYAFSKDQALLLFWKVLEERLGYSKYRIKNYFLHGGSYEVKEEKRKNDSKRTTLSA